MRSKIVALSKNEEFKSLLKKKKVSNKYATIFFGKLDKKEKLTVGHFIQLHDSESKNMTCNHLPS